jgi:dihydrofolate reductase
VFSRTLTPESAPGVELSREDAATFVARLKTAPGGGICVMGGGELAASLLDADLVDEVGLNIHPVLLGDGIPMFPTRRIPLELELIETRAIAHGCVYALYRVNR